MIGLTLMPRSPFEIRRESVDDFCNRRRPPPVMSDLDRRLGECDRRDHGDTNARDPRPTV
jgi:hypothetical protein